MICGVVATNISGYGLCTVCRAWHWSPASI